ncbi:hypothetical protein [Paraburkholderia sp. BL6669N2]|uniref:hypothetical protein n=1 Tax=Paraburkholderia sp. BL6669N2 TaxID=1938807 RepID=UPI0011C081ED|nr:hypothetical protein [Paraburkholderia sp. BL6669N2]
MVVRRAENGGTSYPGLPGHLQEIDAAPVYVEGFGADPVSPLAPLVEVPWNAVGIEHTQTDFDRPQP